ncbi:MAG TPA: ROK family transcriptional regulator [Nocardioides sp.]|nr:ROK family transcriptional regulator [Nocardioides sp.]
MKESARLRPTYKLLAEDTRRHHRSLILQQLFTGGAVSRADLARATGLTRVTVSDLVASLMTDGLLAEMGPPVETKVGKPPTLVGLVPDSFHVLAIELAQDDRIVGAVTDLRGDVKHRVELLRRGVRGTQAVDLVVGLAEQLLAASDRPILGLGIASPGVVDAAGMVLDARSLGWQRLDLVARLTAEIGVPVHVANDAQAAVLAEYALSAAGSTADLLLLQIGTGVGAGLVIGGALVRGHGWAAGEIGHVQVDPDGEDCDCGRRGCLETILAVRRLRESTDLAAVGTVLGGVLAPIVALLNLREIVLAGPTELLDGDVREYADRAIRERVMPVSAEGLELRVSPLGEGVVLAGATVLVLQRELGVS